MYSKIGYTVYQHLKIKNNKNQTESREPKHKTEVSTENTEENIDNEIETQMTDVVASKDGQNVNKTQVLECVKMTSASTKRRKRDKKITNKLTYIFIVITIVFLISYIPKVGFLIYVAIHPDYWEHISGPRLSGAMFGESFFLLNNIVNPFVYAFMDRKFRKESKQFFQDIFRNYKTCCSFH